MKSYITKQEEKWDIYDDMKLKNMLLLYDQSVTEQMKKIFPNIQRSENKTENNNFLPISYANLRLNNSASEMVASILICGECQ